MLKIGLTGGIGAGKSYVSKIFSFLGIPIFYADLAAKYLMVYDPALVQEVKKLLGDQAYEGKDLNRQFIADQIFNDEKKLMALNSIVHPKVNEAARQWFDWQTTAYAIEESALIYEAGYRETFDMIISVSAPVELRIQRVMDRDKTSKEEVLQRMKRQWPQEKKDELADYVINNDGQSSTIKRVIEIHKQLLDSSLKS